MGENQDPNMSVLGAFSSAPKNLEPEQTSKNLEELVEHFVEKKCKEVVERMVKERMKILEQRLMIWMKQQMKDAEMEGKRVKIKQENKIALSSAKTEHATLQENIRMFNLLSASLGIDWDVVNLGKAVTEDQPEKTSEKSKSGRQWYRPFNISPEENQKMVVKDMKASSSTMSPRPYFLQKTTSWPHPSTSAHVDSTAYPAQLPQPAFRARPASTHLTSSPTPAKWPQPAFMARASSPPPFLPPAFSTPTCGPSRFLADDDKGPALIQAVKTRQLPEVQDLLNSGADVNNTDSSGQTALHFAVGNSHAEMVALLIRNAAKVNYSDHNGTTPLHKAAPLGSARCVSLLIGAGANINAQDDKGFAPIHLASQRGRKISIGMLLAAGADNRIRNSNGETPADVAYSPGVRKLLDL